MERTKKSSAKKTGVALDEKILAAYREHLLIEGVRPNSVYKFCLDLGIPESEFYNVFSSFESIDRIMMNGFIEKTILRLRADDSYVAFSTREKVLAFYFTLIEEFKSQRSLVLIFLNTTQRLELVPDSLKTFKTTFGTFIHTILEEGKLTGEIATRPVLDKQYPRLFWMHLGFVLHFWKNDNSAGFENTDAAIEKSVNLAFDLVGKGTVDSVIDFGKFLYQTKTA